MNQNLIEEHIQKFKKTNTSLVKNMFEGCKGEEFTPMLNCLVYEKGTEKFNIAVFMLPGPLMNSDSAKEMITKILLPKLIQELETKHQIPVCISWTSDVFLRQMTYNKDKPMPTQAEINILKKDLPKREALMITYETKLTAEVEHYVYERTPQFRFTGEKSGEKVVGIKGRFMNLFRLTPSDN